MAQVEYMHVERLMTTKSALDKQYGVSTLEELLNNWGKAGWNLVYFARKSSAEVELVMQQSETSTGRSGTAVERA